MTRNTIVCCAISFGYGPASILILIATALRKRGLRTVFLGTGIAQELATRSHGAFDELVYAGPQDGLAREVVASSEGLLSSMDRDYVGQARALERPVFVVDA